MGIPEVKQNKCTKNIWSNNDWKFSTIHEGHKTTDPGSSGNTMQEKYKRKKSTLGISYSVYPKSKSWKKPEGGRGNILPIEE